jgi:hypothetical protein
MKSTPGALLDFFVLSTRSTEILIVSLVSWRQNLCLQNGSALRGGCLNQVTKLGCHMLPYVATSLSSNWIQTESCWESNGKTKSASRSTLLTFCLLNQKASAALHYRDPHCSIYLQNIQRRRCQASTGGRMARATPRLKPRYYSEIEEIHIWLALL